MAFEFRKLELRNWKNFTHVEVPIGRRLFLVGPNASGKSNFLDVFRFLRDLSAPGGGLQHAVHRRGGVSALRCLAARRHPDVAIGVWLERAGESWTYELAFNQDKQRRPVVKRERVTRQAQGRLDVILERPSEADRTDPTQLTQTHLEQVNVNRDFRDLTDFFASIRYLHIVPQLVREPDRSVGRANDPYGGDFLAQLAKTNEKTQRARLRRIQEALQVAVPQLTSIELWRDAHGTPHLRGKYRHWRPQGAWQQEEQFSDGTLRLMGLLWVALDRTGPLLLEEPELSLHPGITRFLPQILARAQRRAGRQIFLSTHSPDLLCDEGIGLDEVALIQPGPAGADVSLAASHSDIVRLLEGGLSLADAVMPRTTPPDAQQLALFPDMSNGA
ncbi:MAG: AAA family ATPase [Chloracidobacterium sp.]|uniref:AAA family ATPase n=1 Tax=Chloracidobacterium validum TaxID=2821543 RepID=A0ABX8BC01_9BACT|nr:ATP-binding protein [Chloracidobacterium validum]QUW04201.1 AAA family ATPase [Chloracidobacterium validum]